MSPPDATRSPRGAAIISVASFVVAVGLLLAAVRPSPRSTLQSHWLYFALWAAPAVALFIVALGKGRRELRSIGAGATVVLLIWAALKHPVCVPITDEERPSFESVLSLRDRAARGEPFCELGGRWYQCKSLLARAFFF